MTKKSKYIICKIVSCLIVGFLTTEIGQLLCLNFYLSIIVAFCCGCFLQICFFNDIEKKSRILEK